MLGVVAACAGGDSDDDAAPTSSFFVEEVAGVSSPARVVDDAAEGEVVVVIGDTVDATLSIVQCERGSLADLDESGQTVALLDIVARTDGAAVSIRRFAAPGEALTLTDTVTYVEGPDDEPTLVLQAQRFEVNGVVTDSRDGDAVGGLVRDDGELVVVRGRFAPPGRFDGPGLAEGSVVARCV